MSDNPTVTDLVTSARSGDQRAWEALVGRYDPLIRSVCRRSGLDRADADDVRQATWLYLVEHLGSLRTPDALPGWLATTARRECLRVQREAKRLPADPDADADTLPDDQAASAEAGMLAAERRAAVRDAEAVLPAGGRRLIALLLEDPPLPYAEISAQLAIPVGSIGPNRRRWLERMRAHPSIAALTAS